VTRGSDEPGFIPEEIRARIARPTIRLSGSVAHSMVASFFDQLLPVLEIQGSILIELFTDGGDAEIGRRLAEEVRLLRHQHGRDIWFLGKTLVASAGVTVMAAFPKDRSWLTRDAALLIHGRRMLKNLHLEGPLGSCRRVLEEMIADIDHGLRLEDRGFAELIDGANVDAEEIARRAYGGWYLTAEEALSRGLVAGLI
jgi:ATP-dependent Clp protease, protease subunit